MKDGELEKSLVNLGLDEGNGSDGGLTEEQLNATIDSGDEDCKKILASIKRANQSLDASLPGKMNTLFYDI